MTAIIVMTLLTGCKKSNDSDESYISEYYFYEDSENNTVNTDTNKKANKDPNRELYGKIDINDYVTVSNYLGVKINTASEDFKKIYANFVYKDMYEYQLSNETVEGCVEFDTSSKNKVELGDIVNIDYTGYKDNKEFDGGAAEDALLVIGSGTFIDGFEDQLIGVKVGKTVKINVTFPSDYHSEELAGVNAMFKVKINSVAKTPEQLYSALNLSSQKVYAEYLKKRTAQQIILNKISKNSEIKNYPKDETEKLYQAAVDLYDEMGYDISSQDKDDIINELIYPLMNTNMIMYYIFDAEGLELYESTLESQNVNQPALAESYAVHDIVMQYLYEKSEIK